MNFTIGQVSEQTGLSIHILRYYEKKGILPVVKRNDSRIRLYGKNNIEWLHFVCGLRKTVMTIIELKGFVHSCITK
ncbi:MULTISPECIES: MerR family transcriptional regulator [Bacillus cereus group]|uniref:MerR family transcriptional regulator n=1 Tax=Bacillus cereus group TaxID=86661 RepID=UPI000AACE87D|nr:MULTISPECIES: MerR family transcriptional regulator [Bacillus cereus group]MBJ8127398.1 MerR family transcriptional regulator [Bacillus cereus]